MIPILLMAAGGLMAILGFLGLFALMVEPLYSMYMIIFKRKDDYVFYETKPGKALLQRNIKSLKGSCIFLLIVGILLFGIGWFLKFGPRGADSLLSDQVESGASVGDDEYDLMKSRLLNASGNYVDEDGTEYANYIIVRGKQVFFKGKLNGKQDEFEGAYEEFEKIMKDVGDRGKIILVDDYGSSYVFHKLEEFLKQ